MLTKSIKNFIKQFLLQTPPVLNISNKKLDRNFVQFPYLDDNGKKNDVYDYVNNFGELNKDKIFYVIKRSPGTGLFSNVTFVLNHLKIAKEFNFFPVIDMENFITIYNEPNKINRTANSWNYYFQNFNNFNLQEVYKSNKVIITNNKFYHTFKYDLFKDKNLKEIFKNEIKINKRLNKVIEFIKKKHFNSKILGIHFRGTSYKRSPGHPLPATKKQMISLVKNIKKKYNINKIFLATEETQYLEIILKEFKDDVYYLKSPYRSNKNDAFKIYPRKNHRYKLGREILIETYLLSSCDHFIFVNSNVSSAALALEINKNQIKYEINNGMNSKSQLISPWLWYIKKLLPSFLGGFKDYNIN